VTAVQVLGAVAAVVASCGVIYRGLLLPVHRWANRLEKTMGFVEEQMKPNSGSSLRDSLDRIENRLTLVETYITKPD
jgi:hypothetical protein